MWILNFFVIFTFTIASINAAGEYCYSQDDKPYGYFGPKTPYSHVRQAELSIPKDCSVEYVWGLIRHGARYASEEDELTSEILKSVRDEIVQNHKKHNRGTLCKDDLEDLQNWKFPWEDKLYSKLMPSGWRDMENVAENMKNMLSLKSASKDKYRVQSSTANRCQNSAIAFTNELYKVTSNDVDESNIQISNNMLQIQSSKKSSDVEELNKFKKSILMDDVLSQISSRLGFAAKLDFDFVLKLYKQCIFEKNLNIKSKSAFCCAFTPDHMKIMEYFQDLDAYYTLGYGESKVKDQACPLVMDLYKRLENANTKSNPSESGAFYFTVAQTLIPFLTKLGLFRDNQPLTSDNYATAGNSRLWRTSFMSPFGGNFLAVMYKCPSEMAVSFYLNEALVKFPSCKDGLCTWPALRDGPLKTEILKDCDGVMELDAAKDVQKKDEKAASENVQKKEEKATSDNSQKNDKSDKTTNPTQDNSKDVEEGSEILRKIIEALISEMKKNNGNSLGDLMKSFSKDGDQKENKGKSEEGTKETAKTESSSPKDAKKSGAAGLHSMEFQTICLIALLTIVGVLGKFI